ncbi:MAG: AMP-dependent synthetase [Rhodospirillales bacterium]|nr:AMP-dependent synthetase [Rhodospirillales bacterium]
MSERDLHENLIHRINVGDLLTRSAARAPRHMVIVDGDRRITYRAFNEWVNRTAHGLAGLGFARGDALALMSGNSAEFLVTYFACAKLGVVCVPINLFWRHGELAYVLDHAVVRGIVVEAALLEQLGTATEGMGQVEAVIVVGTAAADAPDLGAVRLLDFEALGAGMPVSDPEVIAGDRDAVSYLYTSGTTSSPKGVVTSHTSIYVESLGVAIDTRMTANDRVAAMLPFFHTAQLNAFCTVAVAVGSTIYVQRGFDAPRLLDLIAAEGVSVIFGLPVMYRTLLDLQLGEPRDVSSLRLAVYGMAPMAKAELAKAIEVFDCGFALMFGQTEMSPLSALFRPEHQLSHTGAAGTPSINVQIAIMDEAGALLPEGESGEIVYRSPQALTGYLHNPEATEEAFRHGWFHSGDVGHFDQDGILWFEDRFKDVIKSGGENVASLEVETAVYASEPSILEAAIVGLPHDRWGEAITAFVIPRPGETIDEAAILAKVRDRLSPFKCPKAVIVVDAFPKTATGKVQKVELRKRFAGFYKLMG